MKRFGALLVVLLVVVFVALSYSIWAQSVAVHSVKDCDTVRAVPQGRDIRSFFVDLPLSTPQDIFTVPFGKVFIVTDVITFQGDPLNALLELREGGATGMVKGTIPLYLIQSYTNTIGIPLKSFNSGLPFTEGNAVTLRYSPPYSTGTIKVTISGYLADA